MLKKTLLIFMLLSIVSTALFAQDNSQISGTVIGNGIGIGSALAIAICWSRTHSVLTSILAGFFGWLYVIYYCIVIRNNE